MAGLGVGGLSADQLDALRRDGFLAIESLLTDEDLAPVHDEYERVLASRHRRPAARRRRHPDYHGVDGAHGRLRRQRLLGVDPRLAPSRPAGALRQRAFVARSERQPEAVLEDFEAWKAMWDDAREAIVSGAYPDRIFEDVRWNDQAVC